MITEGDIRALLNASAGLSALMENFSVVPKRNWGPTMTALEWAAFCQSRLPDGWTLVQAETPDAYGKWVAGIKTGLGGDREYACYEAAGDAPGPAIVDGLMGTIQGVMR